MIGVFMLQIEMVCHSSYEYNFDAYEPGSEQPTI